MAPSDGFYYFSTFLLVADGEVALFEIALGDKTICRAGGDNSDNGVDDQDQGSCGGLAQLQAGGLCSILS